MGDVLPFKNIGSFLEETTRFAGSRKGSLTLSHKETPGEGQVWLAVLSFTVDSGEIKKQFVGPSFNSVVIDASRYSRKF